MQLVLTEDQELIGKTAADFVAQRSPIARFRALRDAKDPKGYTPALWKEMAELGWLGIPFPESVGGAGLGLADLAVVLEALGRTLAPEPFLSTILLAGRALAKGGSAEQQQKWLPGIVAGERVLAFAQQEPRSRYDLHRVETKAEKAGSGWRITGEKIQVLDAASADAILVAARTSGSAADASGITLFLVPKGAKGLEIIPQIRIDHRNAGIVRLAGALVAAGDVVGAVDGGGALLEDAVDFATAGLCAEMLGSMAQAFAITVEHLVRARRRARGRRGGRRRGAPRLAREGALLGRVRARRERRRADVRRRRHDRRVRHRPLHEARARGRADVRRRGVPPRPLGEAREVLRARCPLR
jgi:alkylation response protein AidB-like acyl-CoA dehydrogenase